MEKNEITKAITEEGKFLDESGYNVDIPEEEWPKSEAEMNQLYAQERELSKGIKNAFQTSFMNLQAEEVVELIKSKNIEELVFAWAKIHRKIRTIMRKERKTILIVPTSQLLLRASDLLNAS